MSTRIRHHIHQTTPVTCATFVALLAAILLAFPVRASAGSSLRVPADFPTIQAAIDAASPGDTIRVAPGVYLEQITIAKDLTLRGAGSKAGAPDEGSGAGATTIQAPATLSPGPIGGRRSIVTVMGGANVAMSNLRVAGPGAQPCNSPTSLNDGVLVVQDARLDLREAAVTDVHDTPVSACGAPSFATGSAVVIGLSAVAAGGPSPGRATLAHTAVKRYGRTGIAVNGSPSTAGLTHNRIAGVGAPISAGVVLRLGAAARMSHNTITDNLCTDPVCGPDPIAQGQSAGILADHGAGAGTVIENNRLRRNDVGIYLLDSPNCCAVSHNTLADNRFFGEVIQDGDNTISRDSISGGQVGVGVVADTADTIGTLRKVAITGTSVATTKAISCCGFIASVVLASRP